MGYLGYATKVKEYEMKIENILVICEFSMSFQKNYSDYLIKVRLALNLN